MYKKVNFMFALVVLLMMFDFTADAQTIDPQYEVGLWRGFCDAAITYTFDDNTPKQFSVAVPVFDEFNFDATFFVVTSWSPDWNVIRDAAGAGHEIASHTVSHPYLNEINAEQQDGQLKNSKDTIESEVAGYKCLTIAYPYCVPGIDTICSKYYIAARHCQGYIEPSTPADFLRISSIVCGSEGEVMTAQDFQNRAGDASAMSGWCIYLLHGIDGDGGYSPLESAILHESLEYLDSHRDIFWVATFGNAVRYIRERNSVSVTELSLANDSIVIRVTDTLDDEIYNYPVSIRRLLPAEWVSAIAMQNGEEIEIKILEIMDDRFIIFDAVPDKGEVILLKSDALGLHN